MPTNSYSHVLWDWDGCLAKTLHLWVTNYAKTFEEEGIEKTREEIIASMGVFRRDIQTWGYSLKEANRIVKRTHDRAAPELRKVALYPHAKEVVRTLGLRGVKQAIVTKSQLHIVEPATRYHGIRRYLQTMVGGDSVHESQQKPHREPVEKALRILGGTAVRAIIIGDSGTDLKTAINAKIHSALYYPSENEEFYDLAELQKDNPTHTISDLREVINLAYSEIPYSHGS